MQYQVTKNKGEILFQRLQWRFHPILESWGVSCYFCLLHIYFLITAFQGVQTSQWDLKWGVLKLNTSFGIYTAPRSLPAGEETIKSLGSLKDHELHLTTFPIKTNWSVDQQLFIGTISIPVSYLCLWRLFLVEFVYNITLAVPRKEQMVSQVFQVGKMRGQIHALGFPWKSES